MGNSNGVSTVNTPEPIKRNESLSPMHRANVASQIIRSGSYGSSDRITFNDRRRRSSFNRPDRSQSLEQSGVNSPSTSSHSSGNNSYAHVLSVAANDKSCLRQSPQPKFQISGDLNPHQVGLVKRNWKQLMKSLNNDETEVAIRLLTRIFQIDTRNAVYFGLGSVPMAELRHNLLFMRHVKAFEPTLIHVMSHPTNATSLSKHLQVLGGRHVQHTGVTYRSTYWKNFVQALVDVFCTGSNADVYDAFTVLGAFCVEQMRIGYKIEYKLQREAERIARVQLQKRESSLSSSRKH